MRSQEKKRRKKNTADLRGKFKRTNERQFLSTKPEKQDVADETYLATCTWLAIRTVWMLWEYIFTRRRRSEKTNNWFAPGQWSITNNECADRILNAFPVKLAFALVPKAKPLQRWRRLMDCIYTTHIHEQKKGKKFLRKAIYNRLRLGTQHTFPHKNGLPQAPEARDEKDQLNPVMEKKVLH